MGRPLLAVFLLGIDLIPLHQTGASQHHQPLLTTPPAGGGGSSPALSHPSPSAMWCLSLRGGKIMPQLEDRRSRQRSDPSTRQGMHSRPPRLSEGNEINTGGLGSLSFGNIEIDGQHIGMIYENLGQGETDDGGGVSSIIVGKTRAVIQDTQGSRVTEDGWNVGQEAPQAAISGRRGRHGAVYFEAGKSGKWKRVPVPPGMTDRQLLRKMKAQEVFMEKLAPDEKATFADEMEKAEMEARVDGLKPVTSGKFLERRLKERAKKTEKSRQKFQERKEAVIKEKEAKDLEKDKNRRNKGRRGWSGKDDSEVGRKNRGEQRSGMRSTAMGGTRKARRTGRKSKRNRGGGGKRRPGKGGKTGS